MVRSLGTQGQKGRCFGQVKRAILLIFLLGAGWQASAADRLALAGLKAAVIAHYAELLAAEYEDSLGLARQLQTNIGVLLAQPSAEHLDAARKAWIECRTPYSQSEVGRFYDGPIEGIEGYLNAWPIDENYLDYTAEAPEAGIINEVKAFPQITRDVLVGANEKEGEKTVSTGFHAIEFLLWGQDLYADGPGRRPFADYIESADGPGRNAARRRAYLHLLAALLADQLQTLVIDWAPNQPHNYRARFLSLPADTALADIFTGAGNLGSAELSGERILVPYTTKSQENEQSCFSDTTHLDLLNNEAGIQNICLGRYVRLNGAVLEGPGLIALVERVNPKLAAALDRRLAEGMAAVLAIPPPFDQAILGEDKARGRVAIKKSLGALQAQTEALVKAANELGIHFNLK